MAASRHTHTNRRTHRGTNAPTPTSRPLTHPTIHPCLQTPSILTHIIHYAAPPTALTYTYANRHVHTARNHLLLSLALISRSFLEVSLDVLWETQYGIWNLVRCFPGDLYECCEVEGGGSRGGEYPVRLWRFKRKPAGNDWSRFKYYATRIHTLHLNTPPHLHTPPPPLPSLQAYKTLIHHKTLHGPLLPNLHTIQWRDNALVYDTLEPFVPAFAGYTLRSLKVFSTPRCRDRYAESGPKFVEDLLGELYNLRRVSPFLRTFEHKLALLEFSSSPSESNTVSGCRRLGSGIGISRVIPSFANLTAYTCTKDFTYSEYLALSSLPSLESIHGDVAAYIELPSLLTQERPLEFRSLKTLVLNHAHDGTGTGADAGGLQTLISTSRFPSLRKLALRWTHPQAFVSALDKYDYDLLLRSLSTNCAHELLEDIAIGVDSDKGIAIADSPISSKWTIDLTTLSILFTFRNLKRLLLTSRTTFSLGDNDLACLASAWPRLTELRLKELEPTILMHHSRPTLVGIVYLAQRCPELKTLGLTFIPTTSESSSESTITLLPATPWYHILRLRDPHHHPTPLPKLTHLLFPSCPVNSPDRIAKFLHKYLPNLRAERIDNFSMTPSTYGRHGGGGGVYGAASWVDVRAALRRLEERDRKRREKFERLRHWQSVAARVPRPRISGGGADLRETRMKMGIRRRRAEPLFSILS